MLKDAKKAKERAERVGPIGWWVTDIKLYYIIWHIFIYTLYRTRGPTKTNKRFLLNTLEGAVQANKRLKVMELKQSRKPKQ